MNVSLVCLPAWVFLHSIALDMNACLHRFVYNTLDCHPACMLKLVHFIWLLLLYVYTFFFSLVKRATFIAVLLAFVYNLCMISFDCFLLAWFCRGFFLYSSFLFLLLCLSINTLPLNCSLPHFLHFMPSRFHCNSNVDSFKINLLARYSAALWSFDIRWRFKIYSLSSYRSHYLAPKKVQKL